jgi:hypothetical protein
MTQELQEKLKEIAVLLAAATALGGTIVKLRGELQKSGSEVWTNSPWYAAAAVLVLLVIAVWRRDRLFRWLVPRSTVTRRAAFQIGRKYLLGREEDVERLLRGMGWFMRPMIRSPTARWRSSCCVRTGRVRRGGGFAAAARGSAIAPLSETHVSDDVVPEGEGVGVGSYPRYRAPLGRKRVLDATQPAGLGLGISSLWPGPTVT